MSIYEGSELHGKMKKKEMGQEGEGGGGEGKGDSKPETCLLVSEGITNSGKHLTELRLGDGAVVLGVEELEGIAGILVLTLGGRESLLVERLEGGKVNIVI